MPIAIGIGRRDFFFPNLFESTYVIRKLRHETLFSTPVLFTGIGVLFTAIQLPKLLLLLTGNCPLSFLRPQHFLRPLSFAVKNFSGHNSLSFFDRKGTKAAKLSRETFVEKHPNFAVVALLSNSIDSEEIKCIQADETIHPLSFLRSQHSLHPLRLRGKEFFGSQ